MFCNDPDDISKINKDDLYVNFNILECDDEEGYYKMNIGEVLNSKYKIIQKLGKGVFSSVAKAINIETKDEIALKIIRSGDLFQNSGQNELSILKLLNNDDIKQKKHCIRLIDTFEHRKHLCLV